MEKFTCPVCGYPCLTEAPYYGESMEYPSEEICVCCGYQFGCDDGLDRKTSMRYWRKRWVESGYPWFSKWTLQPESWNGKEQLETLIGQENN